MIRIQGKIPRKVALACSGGVDSMAIADFLRRSHDLILIFVHHKTDTSESAYHFLKRYAKDNDIELQVAMIDDKIPAGVSQEEHWRNQRYEVFHSYDIPVITCHHLDDCVETWVWSSLHGEGKIIPYANKNVIRPFRLNKKEKFINWAKQNSVDWQEDKSNTDTKYMRNHIRHKMMPDILKVNPGIQKVVAKKVEMDYNLR